MVGLVCYLLDDDSYELNEWHVKCEALKEPRKQWFLVQPLG